MLPWRFSIVKQNGGGFTSVQTAPVFFNYAPEGT